MKEGSTYFMRNFRVSDNDFQYKMSEHKCKLTFNLLGLLKLMNLTFLKSHLMFLSSRILQKSKKGITARNF
jgi:hypothetical protein